MATLCLIILAALVLKSVTLHVTHMGPGRCRDRPSLELVSARIREEAKLGHPHAEAEALYIQPSSTFADTQYKNAPKILIF